MSYRPDQVLRRYLTPKGVNQLLRAVNIERPFGKRDFLLIYLLYHTGLRVGELSNLNVEHVLNRKGEPREYLDLSPLVVKGRRGRVVPLNSKARIVIEKLVKFNRARGFSTSPGAPLFQNKFHRRLSVRSIQLLFQKYRELADHDLKVTPHTMRHTHATALQNAGVPNRKIQLGLGHANLSTTEKYLGSSRSDLRQDYEKLA